MENSGKYTLKSFTSEPKFCIKRGHWRSVRNCRDFMHYMWSKNIRKQCSYSTLEFEFINCFGTNDRRTVERYLGRPAETVYSKGSAQTVRMNRGTGRIAQFDYMNVRRSPRRIGLLEILGYITLAQEDQVIEQGSVQITRKSKNWIVTIHHDRMDYYTEQATLEAANILPELKADSDSSNDNVCVSSLLGIEGSSLRGKGMGKPILEVSPEKETTEKKEEVIDGTHTCRSSESGSFRKKKPSKLDLALGHDASHPNEESDPQ